MSARVAIYLDANAAAPLRPQVVEALTGLIGTGQLLPNPSSIHSHGRKAKRLMADARESIALSFGKTTDPEQLIFTSSGTEANQLAVQSIFNSRLAQGEKPHWITTPVEHDSVLQMIAWLESQGGSVSMLPVDSNGAPRSEFLGELWRPETALVSTVWVNNETGVITDVPSIAKQVRSRGGVLHVDAAQAWGKLPLSVDELGANLVSFSAHKIGAPAGAGLLWLKPGTRASAVILGKQEKGRRGGTENLLGCVAMGAAAAVLDPLKWAQRVSPLRDQLQDAIERTIPGTIVNGAGAPRVANTLNVSFEGVEGDGLVMALDLAGYSVSSGSACASGVLEPSHVLMAMGRTKTEAMAAVRVSLVDEMPWELLDGFVAALEKTVARVRVRKPAIQAESSFRV